MKTDAGSLLACTPQTTKLFEAKIPGKTAAVHIKVSTYTSQNVVLPGLSCRPHSQTEILTTKTCPLLLTSCAEAMLLPCNGFLSGTMCKAADSDKEGYNKRSKWTGLTAMLKGRPFLRPNNTATGGKSS